MNKQRGISSLAVIIGIVLIGGAVYAVVNRSVLKSYFQTGDKPSQAMEQDRGALEERFETGDIPTADKTVGDEPTAEQFKDTIDSDMNGAVAPKKEEPVKYEAPKNGAPENKKTFTAAEAEKGISFRWTALVPKPKEPVTYRLKVWQLMQGQNSTQAMKSNTPIVTKEVTSTETSAANIYTGPCKPPYLCDFVWNVEAQISGGSPTSQSEPSTFSVSEPPAPVDTIRAETSTGASGSI